MHILITVNAAWNIWNFRRSLVEALQADGHRITILAPHDDSVPSLQAAGCRFISLPMDVKGLNPIADFWLVRRFGRHFRSERPDVVLSYTVKNNLFGALAARPLGLPFIPNITGLGTAFLSGGVLRTIAEGLYRKAFRHPETVFFQNSDDRDFFIQRNLIRTSQAVLVPGSGIDLGHFDVAPFPSGNEPPIFLMIARLLRDKGVAEFVEAAIRVKSLLPQARFQLLGALAPENRGAIDPNVVRGWQAEGTIEYLGQASDVRPHIAAASCVVLPSYREGAPRTLIEAAAMGRPIITTDVPGCRSVIEDGVTGYLCAARSGDGLAQACLKFLELGDGARAAMGRLGREKMQREFDQAIVIGAYRRLLADLEPRLLNDRIPEKTLGSSADVMAKVS